MSITIQKSSSGAYFTVQQSGDVSRPYTVNDYEFIPYSDGTFTLVSKFDEAFLSDGYPSNPKTCLIYKHLYSDIINGDTGQPFADFASLQTYILTNFFRKATGGGGSATPGGSDKQVQFNSSGAFTGDSNFTWDNTNKILSLSKILVNTTSQPSTNSIVWVGDSIIAGSVGLTTQSNRYSTRVSTALGYTEDNRGLAGQTAHSTSVIPAHVAGMAYLYIAYGSNDLHTGDNASTFQTNIGNLVTAALSSGWSANQILLQSMCGYQTAITWPQLTPAALIAYNTAIQAVVTANPGVTYVDAYTNIVSGTLYGPILSMTTDNIHPNDTYGSIALYSVVVGSFKNIYTISTQSAAIQGEIDLSNIKYKNFAPSFSGNLLGVDPTGNISTLFGIPDSTKLLGQLFMHGALIQLYGISTPLVSGFGVAYLPAAFNSATDFAGLNWGSKIYSAFNPTNYAYLDLFNTSGVTKFYNSYNATNSFEFHVSGGTVGNDVSALVIDSVGIVHALLGFNIPTGAGYYEQSSGGSTYGRLQLFDASGNTYLRNSYSAGTLNWFMSGGVTNGNQVQMAKMFANGHFLLQNGGTYTDDGVNTLQIGGSIKSTAPIIASSGYTVAGLPAGTVGMRAYVTDAVSPTYLGTLTGGGSVKCPVFHNGTAWVSA